MTNYWNVPKPDKWGLIVIFAIGTMLAIEINYIIDYNDVQKISEQLASNRNYTSNTIETINGYHQDMWDRLIVIENKLGIEK